MTNRNTETTQSILSLVFIVPTKMSKMSQKEFLCVSKLKEFISSPLTKNFIFPLSKSQKNFTFVSRKFRKKLIFMREKLFFKALLDITYTFYAV